MTKKHEDVVILMKMITNAIDDALIAYTHQCICEELNKNIEEPKLLVEKMV